uniref:Dehydrogenase/reductase SDR family member 11 n=1 Tax=Cacopsylla melanoneura TaxID=428564 RepID=A0A8D8RGN9_9HEMI
MSFPSPRVIVVTGASVGIGAAIVKHQASKGNIVVGMARRAELIEEIKKENASWKVHALKVDLMNEADIVKAFDWIKTNLKRIDVLINNAGVLIATDILKGEMDHWKTLFGVNLFAPVICMREAKSLLSKDGHIVNIGSIAGDRVLPNLVYMGYSSTKHALRVVTDGVRLTLAKEMPKVRVTLIAPGVVETDMSTPFMTASPVEIPSVKPEQVAYSVDHVINTPYFVNVTNLTIQPTSEQF